MFTVSDVETRKASRKSPAPFITSTLQQEASRKHGFSPARTMSIAQKLYEQGHITYMRTDSTTLSSAALAASHAMVTGTFGAAYLGTTTGGKAAKDTPKNAQEVRWVNIK